MVIVLAGTLLYIAGGISFYMWDAHHKNTGFINLLPVNVTVKIRNGTGKTVQTLKKRPTKNPNQRPIRIHDYNRPFWEVKTPFVNCTDNCILSLGSKNEQYFTSEFVIFHVPGVGRKPPKKPLGQVWIYSSLEPPPSQPVYNLQKWNGKFNWTISYRRDADITDTYHTMFLKEVKGTERMYLTSNWQGKTRGAAWFVSHRNARSGRDKFAAKMSKNINIDIFDHYYSKNKCPTKKIKNCYKLLSEKYKFYLSFENNLCRDYVTEKGFNIFTYLPDVIPVLRGIPHYSMFFPPKSYLDPLTFKNISSLVSYQNRLAENKNAFEDYFQWRNFYYYNSDRTRGYCKLCAQAHKASQYRHVYNNIQAWITGSQSDKMCRQAHDIR